MSTILSLSAANERIDELEKQLEDAETRVIALEAGRDSLISFAKTCYRTLQQVLRDHPGTVNPFGKTQPAPATDA
jgi:hypothetical protein